MINSRRGWVARIRSVPRRPAAHRTPTDPPALGVAVLGCGGGGIMHLSHYLRHRETTVRAVFDVDPGRFDDLDRRFPSLRKAVVRSTDPEAILRRPDVDVVSVCTPDHTHAEYALAALQAGKHVLCEKPMATTLEDARRIVAAAERSSRAFVVFQQMRFVPRNQALRQLVAAGRLGEIIYAETGYIHDMRLRAAEFSRWRIDPVHFQHPIFGGCHHLDLLRWLVGEIAEVHTRGTPTGRVTYPVDETYLTSLQFHSGAIGMTLTCLSPRVPREFHPLRIYGTRGSVHDAALFLEAGSGIREQRLPRGYRGVPDFRAQIGHFVDCVRGRAAPMVTARDGLRTVSVCWAAVESSRSGRPVAVPEVNHA